MHVASGRVRRKTFSLRTRGKSHTPNRGACDKALGFTRFLVFEGMLEIQNATKSSCF